MMGWCEKYVISLDYWRISRNIRRKGDHIIILISRFLGQIDKEMTLGIQHELLFEYLSKEKESILDVFGICMTF
jgi:hypothetical protein